MSFRLICRSFNRYLATINTRPTEMFEIGVYVDVKSPHSYLVVNPAMQMGQDYYCKVNFKPYDLSYVDMNLTTEHDRDNPVRKPPDGVAPGWGVPVGNIVSTDQQLAILWQEVMYRVVRRDIFTVSEAPTRWFFLIFGTVVADRAA